MERTEEMTNASAPAKTLDGSYIDWAAVLGGGVVALGVASVFTGFGAALGLSSISVDPNEGGFSLMLIVSAIWIVVTLVASYAAGGYIAGRMRRRVESVSADEVTARDGINGLVVWGLGIVASVFLLGAAASTAVSVAGSAVTAAGSVAGTIATAAGSAAGGMAEGALAAAGAVVPEAMAENPVAYVSDTLLRPAQATAGTSDPATVAREAASIIANVAMTGEISDEERGYLISATVANSAVTQTEATARVDSAVAAAQQTRNDAIQLAADAKAEADRMVQEAQDAAIAAAEVARVSAILTAFLLASAAIVAAAAAFVGAVRGGRHRDEGRIFGGFAYRG